MCLHVTLNWEGGALRKIGGGSARGYVPAKRERKKKRGSNERNRRYGNWVKAGKRTRDGCGLKKGLEGKRQLKRKNCCRVKEREVGEVGIGEFLDRGGLEGVVGKRSRKKRFPGSV